MGLIHNIQNRIQEKLEKHERGLYVVLVFPIAFSCMLTFVTARITNPLFAPVKLIANQNTVLMDRGGRCSERPQIAAGFRFGCTIGK
jgi:hypothetical protein